MSDRLVVEAFMCGVCGRRWAHVHGDDGLVLVQSQRERRCCEADAEHRGPLLHGLLTGDEVEEFVVGREAR